MTDSQSKIQEAAKLLIGANKVVCFTGAGISAESGIPTFRGNDGIWKKYPPALYGNIPGLALSFLLRPGRVRDFAADVVQTIAEAEPNPGHYALAELEQHGRLSALITQNIDNLHEEAGSKKVYPVHGSLFVFRCHKCGKRTKITKDELRAMEQELRSSSRSHWGLAFALKKLALPCDDCGGWSRPDIVLFGESLPMDVFNKATRAAKTCDAMLVVGTSGLVRPAADLPVLAIERGVPVIEINPKKSELTEYVTIYLRGTASKIMSLLAKEVLAVGGRDAKKRTSPTRR